MDYCTAPLNRRSIGVRGFTLLELLIVFALIAIVGALAVFGFRQLLQGRAERSAIQSIQQTVWQGATAAASRGTTLTLSFSSSEFRLVDTRDDRVLKTFALPPTVTTNWPDGQSLTFTPPGRVETASLTALPRPLTVTSESGTTTLTISLIGEVRAEN